MHYYLVLYRARARTHTHTRCGCEFPGMISASSMPVYSQLTEGSPSKYSPGAAVPLTQRCCHCWKRFWNCCCGTAFSAVVTFLCLQYTEIFVPSRQILFLETAKSHSEPNQGKWWMFHFSNRFLGQELFDREHLVSWSIVMMKNPIVGQSSGLFTVSLSNLVAQPQLWYLNVCLNVSDSALCQHFHRFCEILYVYYFRLPRSRDPI